MKNQKNNIWLILAIILVACCMRTPITNLGAMTEIIRDYFHADAAIAGLFTTVTALVFAISSNFMARLGERFGINRVIACGIFCIIIGQLWRAYVGLYGILLATAFVALGISAANVLLPSFIKLCFPDHAATLTSLYTSVMSGMAGVSGGMALALQSYIGWRHTLSLWAVPAAFAFMLWFILSRKPLFPKSGAKDLDAHTKTFSPWRKSLAWWVSGYMGIQSLIYYSIVAWMPSMLASRGIDHALIGWLVFLFQIFNVIGAAFAPILAVRCRDERTINFISGIFYIVGPLSLYYAPIGPWLFCGVSIMGLGGGSTIALAMHLFNARTKSSVMAGRLSGMAQSLGYILAACGPVGLGLLFDVFHQWQAGVIALASLGAILSLCGYQAGKDRYIEIENA